MIIRHVTKCNEMWHMSQSYVTQSHNIEKITEDSEIEILYSIATAYGSHRKHIVL